MQKINYQLSDLWHFLTAPHPTIRDVERQKQSQLLAAFALALIFISALSGMFTVLYYQNALAVFNLIAGFSLASSIYYINRRGSYLAAARLMLAGFFFTIHLSLFDQVGTTIFYVVHLILVCGIFLSLQTAFVIAVASLSIQLPFHIVQPQSYSITRLDAIAFTIISVPVVIVFIAHRRAVAKAQQAELRASNSALQESEARWRSLVENAPDFIMEIGLDLRIRFINYVIPNLKLEDVLGKHIDTYVEPQYKALTAQKITQVIESHQPVEYEVQGLNRDGTYSWYSNIVNPIVDGGEVTGVTMISRDITLRKRAEAQSLAHEVERERFRALEEMIGNLSHDLKTPLGTIRFSLSMLQQVSDATQQQLELATISNQATRLEHLIQNILTMSRLDHIPDFEPMPISLNDLALNIVESVRHTIAQKNVSIDLDLTQPIPSILGDETELDRAIANLVANAISYTPENGSINIKTYNQDGSCVIEVIDTGIGIADEDLPMIFNRFFRSTSARQSRKGGTGLGLAIVKRIIEMHHGKIEVESTIGTGSTFRVILPSAVVAEV